MTKHKKIVLSNKMPLIIAPVVGAKTVTALVMVKTGSKYETAKESGLSHFLEHIFFKGTERRPSTLIISAELDVLGGEYNAFTSKEYTGYYVKVAAGKLGKALDILGDMLTGSKFEAVEIEREKGVIIEELNMYEDNPLMHVEDVLESCLYGDTPAGRDTIGTKETIKSFKRADFLRYFKRQYGANSMTVVLCGAISVADRVAASRIFGSFPKNSWQDKQKVKEKQLHPAVKTVFKNTDQINMALAVRTYPLGHKDELVMKLLSVILGGSMSSRLFISLRERSGLAYYVRTHSEHYTDSGYLSAQAGVPKDKAEAAIKIILEEYKRISNEVVPAAELSRAKDLVSGRLLMQLEASDEIANWYGLQAVTRNKLTDPEEIEKKLRKVTSADILRVAKSIMKQNNLNLALIGPVKKSSDAGLLKLLKL
ncbi:MAG: pitrilysin family protein [bacterium]|nr:pitrilysin family protein [bacterium]